MYFPSTIAITHIHTLTHNTHKHNANSQPARLSGLLLVPGGAVWRQPLYKIKTPTWTKQTQERGDISQRT